MARFYLNSSNININNSLTITAIKVDHNTTNTDSLTAPLSFINAKGDIDGDGKKDIFLQSSFLLVSSNASVFLTQENFLLKGNSLSPGILNLAKIENHKSLFINNNLSWTQGFADINGNNIEELLVTSFELKIQDSRPQIKSVATTFILGSSEFLEFNNLQNLIESGNAFKVIDKDNDVALAFTAGDINQDNINDLAFVSSDTAEDSSESVTKVVFGLESYPANLDISALDGSNGFTVDGNHTLRGIHSDINDDNIDDLIFTNNDSPISYVVFGRNKFPATLDLTDLTSQKGFTIVNKNSDKSDRLLSNFSSDINGDGINDIAVQKTSDIEDTEAKKTDRVSVIYGEKNNFFTYSEENDTTKTIDVASLNGKNGFTIDNPAKIQIIFDINGDNLPDLWVKNPIDDKTYVIFGSNDIAANFNLNSLDGTNGFVIENRGIEPQKNNWLTVIGDVNGDDVRDIALKDRENQSYILLGSKAPFPSSIDLTKKDTNAITISGDKTARGIAELSDINGDGADDIIFNSVIDPQDHTSASHTIVYGDRNLSFATDNSLINPNPEQTIELFRFRNNSFDTGTYVFVDAAERDMILKDANLRSAFSLEGITDKGTVEPAFKANTAPGEGLIPFFRLKNLDVPGTFLFVSSDEYKAIFANNSDQKDRWQKEGLNNQGDDVAEFYLLDSSINGGIKFNRFQNKQNGTFLYAGEAETVAIENNPNLSNLFDNQGTAFESYV